MTVLTNRLRITLIAVALSAMWLLPRAAPAAELMISEVSALAFDVHADSDTLVFSALGQIWRMPLEGGLATAISPTTLVLDRPRLSHDGQHIVAEGGERIGQHTLWLLSRDGGPARELVTAAGRHGDANWHPDGETIVFSSLRAQDHDLWAIRRSDGVTWQVTAAEGDETDPVWENDGRGIVFASNGPRGHTIVRLGDGGTLQRLATRDRRVSAPSLRPGGPSLVFQTEAGDDLRALELLLPVAEFTVKPLLRAGDLENEPVAWRDRDRLLLARNGRLYERELAGARTREIPITAFVTVAEPSAPSGERPAPTEEVTDPRSAPPLVLRTDRIFDPSSGRNLLRRDVRIEAGRITDIVPRRNWGDTLLLEFPETTLLPGFIDTALREQASVDTARLVAGVTAVAVTAPETTDERPGTPVPTQLPVGFSDVRAIANHAARMQAIRDARDAGLQVIANRVLPDLRFGVTTLDADALGDDFMRHADISTLLRLSGARVRDAHRVSATSDVDWRASRVAVMLEPAGVTPPAALAPALDVIARHARGETMDRLLRGITLDAATAAGRPDLGQIRVGGVADLVIVPGDPLRDPEVLLDPIAVVRAGQLYAVSSLLESIAQRRNSLQNPAESAATTSGVVGN
ncbi:MAG: hypothetical protein AAGM16_12005 [Pseudomonadota bacterium]